MKEGAISYASLLILQVVHIPAWRGVIRRRHSVNSALTALFASFLSTLTVRLAAQAAAVIT